MSFEQYRTQVLLLHSEQSALDSLSAGFSDRFTVHCATSGTEALNTLGEVPIHVIVSAQDLPGMSGVEALREAKKRSPETIGILLTGPDDKGVEALVGEEEVFQVISGGISGDDLGKLIDNATRQGRLVALAESANDTRAVPEDTGEHIIMETAENGSSIITDATGSMPALDPHKVGAAVSPGAEAVDVLVLSKDDEFLATIRESTRGLHNVHSAATLAAAEDAIKNEKVGVLVVDAGMVGSNVEKLTLHLRRFTKRLVSIVAGRRDDGEMLMDLINRGKVYRFLLKPVSPGRARLAIEASVKHHLEAPDSAFKVPGGKAAAPAVDAKPEVRKPEPPPATKAPKPEAKAGAKPEKTPGSADDAGPEDRKDPVILPDLDMDKPGDGLSDAFGDKEQSSLAETMSGLVATVSDSISGKSARKDDLPGPGQLPDLDGADSGGGSPFTNPKLLGIAAVAVLVIGGALFWMFSGGDDTSERPPETNRVETPADRPAEPQQPRSDETPAAASAGPVDDLVANARRLRDAGRIYAPLGDNAIESFTAAAAAEPRDREIAEELADVVDQTLSMGESAMLEGRVDDAALAISQVRAADPANPRLPFLTAQLEQMQLRNYLDSARAAILDSRYQDAADAIAAARALAPADSSSLDVVEAELDTARSAERVDDVLATAAARLDAGQLLEPANDNARYYYDLALANDPGNTSAEAGLKMIISSLVLEARAAIDAGRFQTATKLLNDARSIDAQSSEVVAASRALDDARSRRAEAERLEEERRQAAAREAEAERQAAELKQQQDAEAAAAAGAAGAASQAADDAGGSLADDSAPAAATPAPEPVAAAPRRQSNDPVPMSSLTRTKYVAPKYPRAAERRNLSGWVDIVFTVQVDGSVGDVTVRASEPGDVFVASAIKAVEKWEFEPVIENDRYVEKRAGVRMMFAIE